MSGVGAPKCRADPCAGPLSNEIGDGPQDEQRLGHPFMDAMLVRTQVVEKRPLRRGEKEPSDVVHTTLDDMVPISPVEIIILPALLRPVSTTKWKKYSHKGKAILIIR